MMLALGSDSGRTVAADAPDARLGGPTPEGQSQLMLLPGCRTMFEVKGLRAFRGSGFLALGFSGKLWAFGFWGFQGSTAFRASRAFMGLYRAL